MKTEKWPCANQPCSHKTCYNLLTEARPRPTRRPVFIEAAHIVARDPDGRLRGNDENSVAKVYGPDSAANATLIAAAFNAATECADMGYDPIEAVKALPKVLRALITLYVPHANNWKVADWALRLEEARQALAAARGEGKGEG